MLDSLYINNFRLFKELIIEHLGRVNLVIGRNNAGKTCLLEALHLYAKNASPRFLYELIIERGEDWEIRMQLNNEQSVPETENQLRHLFYGYRFPELGKGAIEIGSVKPIQDRLKLHIQAYQTLETENTRRFTRVESSQFLDFEEIELVIEIEEKGEIKSRVRLNETETLTKKRVRLSNSDAKLNVQIVPTSYLNDDKVAILWDQINICPALRQEVFKGLQLIDNQIQEVVLVGRKTDITPILIYQGSDRRIPLKSLGDGMTHLFHILLALVNAKDGFLLIDEFENGLHYTVQPKVWALIFKLAKELNIQVFATTHSKDCVESFHTVWETQENEGTLHRLDNDPDEGVSVMPYDCEIVGYAVEKNMEVR